MSNAASDGGIYHNGRTYAEHCAWLDSLTGDEYRIVHTPVGHLMSLAYIAHFKYALTTLSMEAHERLRFLNYIAGCVDGPITADAVAAIEPACATAVQMLHELNKVPRGQAPRTFQDGDVFRLLSRLNPSLLRALELCQRHQPVPQQRAIQDVAI
jgi:hypothetical protein